MLPSKFMIKALKQAQMALSGGEIPIGAVIIKDGKILASSYNSPIHSHNPTAHAEINVIIKAAKKLNTYRLNGCHIYVTLEPCPMCAQAISLARLDRLYYGASDFKGGGVENGAKIFNQSSCFHKPEVYSGIMENECSKVLKDFFKTRRK